ncbi:MAG: hypothetical protein NTZ40_04500 [Cyanobacteria bacterium]|nr:hypothetical protein [Cyanobacteriota bacterium]
MYRKLRQGQGGFGLQRYHRNRGRGRGGQLPGYGRTGRGHGRWLPAAPVGRSRGPAASPTDLRNTLIAGIALAREAQLATRNLCNFDDTILSLINPFAG